MNPSGNKPGPHRPAAMRVGGFTRLSSVDWPGQLVATIFCQGCPWDCAYCHNPHLLSGEPASASSTSSAAEHLTPWSEVLHFLSRRAGLLDGVVFSGGEPLMQASLPEAVREVRALGFKTALHTGGSFPDRLTGVLPEIDWVGLDVKAPFARYESITRVTGSGERARASLVSLIESGVGFEVRTTIHPDLLGDEALRELAEELHGLGVRRWVLQPFRAEGSRIEAASSAPIIRPETLAALRERIADVQLRDFNG